MNKEKVIHMVLKNYGKILGMLTGLVFSILVICLGIIKTIFIFLCIYIGYILGSKVDNKESIIEILDKILPLGKFK